jgi:hypothetical protein
MKKIYLTIVALLAALSVSLSSCGDDTIWDFVPVQIYINVVDANGTSLIGEGGGLYQKDFTMAYNGTEYTALWDWAKTRAYMPYLFGLYYSSDGSQLVFGELDGNVGEASMTFTMPDGTTHDIYINRTIKTSGSNATVKQTVKLDGNVVKEYDDGDPNISFTFVYNK